METISLDLSIIIPAYNEETGIGSVLSDINKVLSTLDLSYEILVINDGSQDKTAEIAANSGARVVSHPDNLGNGASIKTGIRTARGKLLLMMDADGQHPPGIIPALLSEALNYDMVVGARARESESDVHRNIGNKIYNALASYVSGRKIEDLTSGFRIIQTQIARKFVYLLPNTFSYPSTITLAVLRSGGSLHYIPFESKRRLGKSKIKILQDGFRFLTIILRVATYYSPLKIFIPVSIVMFITGFLYGLYKVIILNASYGPTSAMLMTISVVVFMVGLISEQVAQLMYIWSENRLGMDIEE